MNLEVDNWEALLNQIGDLGRNVRRVENKAIRQGSQVALDIMREEVPYSKIRSPGYKHMRDDLAIGRVKEVDGIKISEVGPTTGKNGTRWRAHFLIKGTKNMPPNDFILRTQQRGLNQIRTAMITELNRVLAIG